MLETSVFPRSLALVDNSIRSFNSQVNICCLLILLPPRNDRVRVRLVVRKSGKMNQIQFNPFSGCGGETCGYKTQVNQLQTGESKMSLKTHQRLNPKERFEDLLNPSSTRNCVHNKNKYNCVDCRGRGICSHAVRRDICKICKGSAICPHNRQKQQCRECRGSAICKHDKRKGNCLECGGSSYCMHQKPKQYCVECGGSSICRHKIRKVYCVQCGGSAICIHLKKKYHCKECKKACQVHGIRFCRDCALNKLISSGESVPNEMMKRMEM